MLNWIMQVKKNRVLNMALNSSVFLSITLNFIFLACIILFCDIKYEVSDDFVMASIISGAYGNGYNPHLIFINILWGYLLLPFYYIFPNISWYLIAQLLLCFLSFTLISYMFLEKLNKVTAFLLITLLLTFYGDDVYILVQFTKTATLAVMGGGIVFLWALWAERSWQLKLASSIICIGGTLVRFNSIYIVGVFLLLPILTEFIKCMSLKRVESTKKVIRVLLLGFFVVCTAFGMKAIDTYIYNQNEEYAYFREFGKARASIVDASDYGYWAYKEEFDKIGISENDYTILRTWNFSDPEYFTIEKLQKIGEIINEYKKNVGISKEILFENIQHRNIWSYPACIAMVLLLVLSIVYLKKWWLSLCSAIIAILYIIYFFSIERIVYRVEFSVLLCGFLCMAYFWRNSELQSGLINIETKRICAIISLICLFAEALLFYPDSSYLDITNETRKDYIEEFFYNSWDYDARRYRKVVNRNKPQNGLIREIEENEDKFYFLDFQTTVQTLYYEWNPFTSLQKNFYKNTLYFAGVMMEFPDYKEVLEKNGLKNPMKNLVEEEVYIVDSEDKTLKYKLNYLREHYFPNAKAELYKEIDGYQIWKISNN